MNCYYTGKLNKKVFGGKRHEKVVMRYFTYRGKCLYCRM